MNTLHPASPLPPPVLPKRNHRTMFIIGGVVAAGIAAAILVATGVSITRGDTAAAESGTDSFRVYPFEVRDNFMTACTDGGAPGRYCACVLNVVEDEMPLAEFLELDREMALTGVLPPAIEALWLESGCV